MDNMAHTGYLIMHACFVCQGKKKKQVLYAVDNCAYFYDILRPVRISFGRSVISKLRLF